ncbi:MAG: SAM-dependent methyltransferase, partial [Bifidobacterium adolescentis]
MSDGPLLNDVTRAFAEAHRNEDVRDLALKTKRTADLDLPAALDQIAGWQIARNKLPQWAACADIVYPAHISMEQCSSQFTAQYKAEIARRLLRSLPQSAGQTANDVTMTDLTGGFGVDFSYLARGFGHATYVERQSHLCELAAHNMAALGLTQAQVVCGDGVEYLRAMEPAQLIYIDPARRDEHGARTYAIEDCTPDVLALRDLLLAKARYVMIKLSPMLDWRKAVDDFAGTVAEVHIVSTGNECKELL